MLSASAGPVYSTKTAELGETSDGTMKFIDSVLALLANA